MFIQIIIIIKVGKVLKELKYFSLSITADNAMVEHMIQFAMLTYHFKIIT